MQTPEQSIFNKDSCPLVSVIVPVLNGEAYIESCLTQLADQTWRNLEILVVDDGSTDATGQIARRFSMSDDRIRVIGTGVCQETFHARLAGFTEAKGDYVMSVDSDDGCSADYVESLLRAARGTGADLAVCDHFLLCGEGSAPIDGALLQNAHREYLTPVDLEAEHFRLEAEDGKVDQSLIALWSKIIRRDLLDRALPYLTAVKRPLRYYEDALYSAVFYHFSIRSVFTHEGTYYYRAHPSSFAKADYGAIVGKMVTDQLEMIIQLRRMMIATKADSKTYGSFEAWREKLWTLQEYRYEINLHTKETMGGGKEAVYPAPSAGQTIFVFVLPGLGHVTPLVPLMRFFVGKGFQVRAYSISETAPQMERAGARLVSLDPLFEMLEGDSYVRASSPFNMLKLVQMMDEMIRKDVGRYQPVCAIVDSQTIWGRLLAGKYHIPMVLSSATMIMNRQTMREYFHDYERAVRAMEEGDIAGRLKELETQGFPHTDIYSLYGVRESDNCVVYVSKELQACADSLDPEHTFFAGYAQDLEQSPGSCASGRALVYISMGTSSFNTGFFFRNCVTAFRDREDVDLLMAVGTEENVKLLGKLPEHIRAVPFVDQREVLKKTSVLIFHGGMNTFRDGFLAGVPMVIIPRAFDQKGNGRRLEELGAGIMLDNNRPETLRRSVRLLLSVPSYRIRSREVGENMRKCGGPEAAGRWILSRIGMEEEARF